MMRVSLSLTAVAVIFLGLWLIASGFTESAPAQVIAAPPCSRAASFFSS